jgi:phenylacetic acid degradation operon negative regulatory protein
VLAPAVAQAGTILSPTAESALVGQLRLADALEHAMRHDPLLPLDLRPRPWPPSRLRAWLEMWKALTDQLPEEILYREWLTPEPGRPDQISH